MGARVLLARDHDRGGTVARRADVEQPERVGDDRRRQHVVDADFLPVTGVGVGETVLRVLHLHACEILAGRAEELHPPARVQTEVGRVRRAEQAEAQPVGIVAALALVGCEEAFRCRVRADDEGDVAESGEDLRPCGRQRGDARRARGVGRRDLRAVPAQRLRERGARDIPGVSVAHGLAARDELDVGPRDTRVRERGLRGHDAVLDEVAAPLAPRVHPDAEDGDVAISAHRSVPFVAAGAHCQTTYSCSSSV